MAFPKKSPANSFSAGTCSPHPPNDVTISLPNSLGVTRDFGNAKASSLDVRTRATKVDPNFPRLVTATHRYQTTPLSVTDW